MGQNQVQRARERYEGHTFGQWFALKFIPGFSQPFRQKPSVLCRCLGCGEERSVETGSLINGRSASCGSTQCSTRGTHYQTDTPEYGAWANAKYRCSNPNHHEWEHYGGRAIPITMCAGYRESFEMFFADLGSKPDSKYTLGRIRNDDGYWCGHCEECLTEGHTANCEWQTWDVQSRLKQTNRMITFDDRTQCLTDWANEKGMSVPCLRARLKRWSVEKALTTPIR